MLAINVALESTTSNTEIPHGLPINQFFCNKSTLSSVKTYTTFTPKQNQWCTLRFATLIALKLTNSNSNKCVTIQGSVMAKPTERKANTRKGTPLNTKRKQ